LGIEVVTRAFDGIPSRFPALAVSLIVSSAKAGSRALQLGSGDDGERADLAMRG
jgi:hypothetical protein